MSVDPNLPFVRNGGLYVEIYVSCIDYLPESLASSHDVSAVEFRPLSEPWQR